MVTEVFATGFPFDVMIGFRVAFPVELRFFAGHSHTAAVWLISKLAYPHGGNYYSWH